MTSPDTSSTSTSSATEASSPLPTQSTSTGIPTTSSSSEPVHLLVLIHGMWGNPTHLAELSRIYQEVLDERHKEGEERVHVLVAETNKETSTYDGVDWGGERVVKEIEKKIESLEEEGGKVTKFSVTGYSLGGLIARYVVGILHQKRFFDSVQPMNFTTVATPHIGIVRYPNWRSKLFSLLGPRLLSRTGEQFYLTDKWSARGRPLLQVMADPDRVFFQALLKFEQVRFYANAVNDTTVPYMTAAAEAHDPFEEHAFSGIKIELDEKYSPIIKSYIPNFTPVNQRPSKPSVFTREGLKRLKVPLPPALNFKFPFNIAMIVAIPILFPVLLSLVTYRLSADSRSSRARIKLLEADESYAQRLAHVLHQMEKSMEDTMAEMIDDPGDTAEAEGHIDVAGESPTRHRNILSRKKLLKPSSASPSTSAQSLSATQTPIPPTTPPLAYHAPPETETYTPTTSPFLTEMQVEIVGMLNTLPHLQKELAFIDPVLNSHAVIVSRDVKRFYHHKIGEGVLRHLADHFVL